MAEKLLSIIVPIFNEEKLVASALPTIFALSINHEVIVVNDGSTDKTKLILDGLQASYDFKLIHQVSNQGKGAAVKRGLEEMSGDYFIVCDADAEYDPKDIIKLFTAIKNQAPQTAVFGSRFLNNYPLNFHRLVNYFLTALTNYFFGSHLSDMETCFKLIPRDALNKLNLSGRRFEIEPEITAQLLRTGYNIVELPISYNRRSYSEGKKIKARDGLLAIQTLWDEWRKK
ncbi:MAG: glycosyltransferase family 2 protein [Patescibacteria group bacterium]